jgi:hypothetical protein
VTTEAEGLNINAIGVILMVVGILGLVLSMIFWSSWGGFRQRRSATYVDDGVAPVARPRRRATVVEEDDVAPGPPPP